MPNHSKVVVKVPRKGRYNSISYHQGCALRARHHQRASGAYGHFGSTRALRRWRRYLLFAGQRAQQGEGYLPPDPPRCVCCALSAPGGRNGRPCARGARCRRLWHRCGHWRGHGCRHGRGSPAWARGSFDVKRPELKCSEVI